MTRIFVALGTNLGDRKANLAEALRRLSTLMQVTHQSSIYETAPWGVQAQPDFLNMVAEGDTKLEPEALLVGLKKIEREMGRVETVRFGPRLIDLDILLYGNQSVESDNLKIPHARLAERRFVLVPLAELAPDLMHPVLRKSMRELLAALPDESDVIKLA